MGVSIWRNRVSSKILRC